MGIGGFPCLLRIHWSKSHFILTLLMSGQLRSVCSLVSCRGQRGRKPSLSKGPVHSVPQCPFSPQDPQTASVLATMRWPTAVFFLDFSFSSFVSAALIVGVLMAWSPRSSILTLAAASGSASMPTSGTVSFTPASSVISFLIVFASLLSFPLLPALLVPPTIVQYRCDGIVKMS